MLYLMMHKEEINAMVKFKRGMKIITHFEKFENITMDLQLSEVEKLLFIKRTFDPSLHDFIHYGHFKNFSEFQQKCYIQFHGDANLKEVENELLRFKQALLSPLDYINEHDIIYLKYQRKFALAQQLNPELIKQERKLTAFNIKYHFIQNANDKTRKAIFKGKYDTMDEIRKTLKKLENQMRAEIEYGPAKRHGSGAMESFAIERSANNGAGAGAANDNEGRGGYGGRYGQEKRWI